MAAIGGLVEAPIHIRRPANNDLGERLTGCDLERTIDARMKET